MYPFVKKDGGEYIPINIVESDIYEGVYKLLNEDKRRRVIRENGESEVLKKIIDNVSNLIIKRSEIIQKVLDDTI